MKIKFISETIVSVFLALITILLFKPMYLLMPESSHSMIVFSLVVIFIAFAAFVWRERGRDEREIYHKYMAGRFAYLAGSSALVVGIVFQSLKDSIDIWLLVALLAMTLAKTITLFVSQLKN